MNILIKEINEKIINHLHDSIRQKPVQGNYLERHQKKIIALLNIVGFEATIDNVTIDPKTYWAHCDIPGISMDGEERVIKVQHGNNEISGKLTFSNSKLILETFDGPFMMDLLFLDGPLMFYSDSAALFLMLFRNLGAIKTVTNKNGARVFDWMSRPEIKAPVNEVEETF